MARGESLAATASTVRRWLLIEQPGAWGARALLESKLPLDVASGLDTAARAAGVRVLLVRRRDDEARSDAEPRSAFLVRSDRVHRWIERRPFDDPAQLLDIDLTSVDGDEPPGVGEVVGGSMFLVCTNGKHDPCCADFGRPVVRALREEGVEVWESSHVGGDRFAANVVCLPTGIYYGRVPPSDAARIIREHDEGLLDLDTFRGRSCFPTMVQAAEIFARRELGERGIHAMHLESVTDHGPDRRLVRFTRHGEPVEVVVRREKAPPAQLTCRDVTSDPWQYVLESLSP
jgi:hypothetical protein